MVIVVPLTVQFPAGPGPNTNGTPGGVGFEGVIAVPRDAHAVAGVPINAALMVTAVVGGVTVRTGRGKATSVGSATMFPPITPVNPLTAPAVHSPTPVRGVYKLPATFTLPCTCRFPFEPRSPPVASVVAATVPMLES